MNKTGHSAASRGVTRDRESLLATLAKVDAEGWDGPTGTALLKYARSEVVRPLVGVVGLRGLAAEQAEATGWAAAWELLRGPAMRVAESPWGLLWVSVRRSILGELVAGEYITAPREAWRLRATAGTEPDPMPQGPLPRPLSLEALAERGCQPATTTHPASQAGGELIDTLISAFENAGWCPVLARRMVVQIAATAPSSPPAARAAHGWRHLAVEVGIAPWQARRATVVVLGAPGWPGLAQRVHEHGPAVVRRADVRRALRSTLCPGVPTPATLPSSA